jgi:hypothetical protein
MVLWYSLHAEVAACASGWSASVALLVLINLELPVTPWCTPVGSSGMLEAFSYVVRMFSGVLSDKMTSRKAAIAAGFAMGAAAKFGMSAATTTVQLFVTKAMDRLGNGVQVSDVPGLVRHQSGHGATAAHTACLQSCSETRESLHGISSAQRVGLVIAVCC